MEWDREKYRKKLEKQIAGFNRQELCWFASRNALRALPLLTARNQQFSYWEDNVNQHLLSIFRACSFSVYASLNSSGIISAAAYAAYAAAAYAADAADAAAAAAAAAYAYAAADAADAADAVVVAAGFTNRTHQKVILKQIQQDIEAINAHHNLEFIPVWRETTQEITHLENRFLKALDNTGMGYWADEYSNWLTGKFDLKKIERCLWLEPSLIDEGSSAVIAFLQRAAQEGTRKQAEARIVFLGHGAVGKTSLIKRLWGEPLPETEDPTEVAVSEHQQPIGGEPGTVHYWDFGGQQYLHPAHQYFLREKCVYVVVMKARTSSESELVEYWLEHVRTFGNGSPTIIVQNYVDELPGYGMKADFPFNLTEIREEYPFVCGCFNMSCTKDYDSNALPIKEREWGLFAVQQAIEQMLCDSTILHAQSPHSWFALKEKLREALHRDNKTSLDKTTVLNMCRECGIEEDTKEVLQAMNALGVALRYEDVDPDWFVLNPDWLAKTLYHLLNTAQSRQLHGVLTASLVEQLFDPKQFPTAPKVARDKMLTLLKLLEKFDLAFSWKGQGYRVPMLSPMHTPDFSPSKGEAISASTCMARFMPPALFHRFVTLCGQEVEANFIWQNGCRLRGLGATAQLGLDKQEKVILIQVWGSREARGEYFKVLTKRLRGLLGDVAYRNLQYTSHLGFGGQQFHQNQVFHGLLNDKLTIPNAEGMEVSAEIILEQFFGRNMPRYGELFLGYQAITAQNTKMDQEIHALRQLLQDKMQQPININNQASAHSISEASVQVNITMTAKVLTEFSGEMDKVRFDIRKEQGEEFGDLRDYIKETQDLIERFKNNRAVDAIAQDERLNLLSRIKSMAGDVCKAAKAMESVIGVATGLFGIYRKFQGL